MSTPPDFPNPSPRVPMSREALGMWLGILGVAMFAITLPMTRLATGTTAAPQLSPWFVTFGRAVLAAGLSALFLLVTRSPRPTPAQWKPLAIAMLGNAIGYPLMLGIALRSVTASHAAVITALLPLATAAIAAWVLHQRARLGFWLCAALGSGLVMVFSLLRAYQLGHGFGLAWSDLLLVLAVVAASFGYVYGAQVTPELGAERVICWVWADWSTWACFPCGSAFLPGTAAWPWAAHCGSVKRNCCNRFCPSWRPCHCWENRWTP
jgi:drug/metabolite transporter (DMT)-like permease